MSSQIVLYGATGHTGGFILRELEAQGLHPGLCGRVGERLALLGAQHPASSVLVASVDDQVALCTAFAGARVVINAAGPFLETALPVARAARAVGAHYLDVTAEQAAAQSVLDDASRRLGAHDAESPSLTIPGVAFFGGLADLLVSAATEGWDAIDSVEVAMGIDRWWPTDGTLRTGERNTAPRVVIDRGQFVPAAAPEPKEWAFPPPLGRQRMLSTPLSEMVLLRSHLPVTRATTYLSCSALEDLANPATGVPVPLDDSGRSAQQFCVEIVARRGDVVARRSAAGRDIYAATAPLVAEATRRLLGGQVRIATGPASPGAAFDARSFLEQLDPAQIRVWDPGT